MKAIILAAGYGTRLYPLTLNQPKPLLEVAGKPMVEHLLKKLSVIPELDTVYVVTNQKFYQHFLDWKESFQSDINVVIVNDGTTCNEDRLGAIGDINYVVQNQNVDDDVIILGGDNLFENDLLPMYVQFKEKGSTIAVFDVGDLEKAKSFGVVETDDNDKIVSFEEKPSEPKSTLSATLIYMLKRVDMKKLPISIEKFGADKSGNFVQYLSETGDVYSFTFLQRWFDIGTKDALDEADRTYKG